MTTSNIFLVYDVILKKQTVTQPSNRAFKKRSLSRMILITTTLFILLTLADNILNAFYLSFIVVQDYGYDLLFFCDCLTFSYHGLHFLILILTNKRFSNEFKLTFKLKRLNNKVGNIGGNVKNTVISKNKIAINIITNN